MKLRFEIDFFSVKVSRVVLFFKKEQWGENVHMAGLPTIEGSAEVVEKTGER